MPVKVTLPLTFTVTIEAVIPAKLALGLNSKLFTMTLPAPLIVLPDACAAVNVNVLSVLTVMTSNIPILKFVFVDISISALIVALMFPDLSITLLKLLESVPSVVKLTI